jgi:outer membrane immunogenic protein
MMLSTVEWGTPMKKLVLATLVAIAATGSAGAADLPVKAPPMTAAAPVSSWTGCYVSGGIGYGLYAQDHRESFLDGTPDSFNQTSGAQGWLGRVGVGCDYQVAPQFVIGAFGDYDWDSIKGDHTLSMFTFPFVGTEKLSSSWAAGARIGYLPYPNLLTFISGGWTGAHFDAYTLSYNFVGGGPPVFGVNADTRNGWFLGGGYEYQLPFAQNLTWKTEYRFSDFGDRTDTVYTLATGTPLELTDSRKFVQTVTTSLVWRFNFGGPVVARY